jgi:hypothetical protein
MISHASQCDKECRSGAVYLSDGYSIWKFAPYEHPLIRGIKDNDWEESAFTSLDEFTRDAGSTITRYYEIPASEGEA